MRFLIAIMVVVPLTAQDPAAQNPPDQAKPASDQAKPAADQSKPADQAKPADQPAAPSPVPATENWLSGFVDLGYRWVEVGGNVSVYKSVVNYNSGPKLLNADLTVTDPGHRLFDHTHIRASDIGNDPNSTFHLDAEKAKSYMFSVDFRDLAYYNFLPSYADPLLSRGVMLNEQSFATRKHLASFSLDLLPGNWWTPYFGYDRDLNYGNGISTLYTDANQFPVPMTEQNLTSLYRGGIQFQFRRFHATLEEGGTTFHDNQDLYQSSSSPINYGNIITPIFNQTTYLSGLFASYGITGSSTYTKALFTANAASWLDLYGQFLYSQPSTDINYQQYNTGNFLLQSQLLFYTGESYLVTSAGKMPHTTGNLGGEIRPHRRVRLIETWLTDRMHNSGSAGQNNTLTNETLSEQITAALSSSLVNNYNQVESDIFFDATSKIMLRGGYRYVWGDASDAVLPPEGLVSSEMDRMRSNVGLGAFAYRLSQKLRVSADAEIGRSGNAYFRTSLYDYEKVRAQLRYQALKNFSLSADFMALINNNPTPGVNFKYRAQQESLSFFWTLLGAFDFQASYTRSTVYSDIPYLDPGTLGTQTSLYRDNAHIGTALFNIHLPHSGSFAPKITAGGSFFISSGSRPTNYYQPIVSLWLPFGKHVSWFADWRYYGYAEPFYLYEGFRAQLVTTGVRLTR